MKLADERHLTFIHPFDDLDVATGQGTIAMEIVQELPTVDYILVPVGGGGLVTGVSTLAKMLNPKIKVIGVEPKNAASMTEALKNDGPVTLPSANTIADGTAVKRVGTKIFPYCKENIAQMLTVDDSRLIGAFLNMVENHKMIVENSGLLPVAALDQLDLKGKKAVCYPGFESRLTGAEVLAVPVVTDGHITTSRGMGTAIAFALELTKRLKDEETAKQVGRSIIYNV